MNVYVAESTYGNSLVWAYYPSAVEPPYEHYDGIIIRVGLQPHRTTTSLSHETGHCDHLIHTCGFSR